MGSSSRSLLAVQADDYYRDILREFGFIRCGSSRAYVQFEAVFERNSEYLRSTRAIEDFERICAKFVDAAGSSKLDFQGPTHPNGHKLSMQVEYDLAVEMLWNRAVVPSAFVEVSSAVVALIQHDLERCPVHFLTRSDKRHRSTVRAILYLPSESPGVDWHVDPCLAQFVSVPAGDAALHVTKGRHIPDPGVLEPQVGYQWTPVVAHETAEMVLMLGQQAGSFGDGLRATLHAVFPITEPRLVFTHFLWAS